VLLLSVLAGLYFSSTPVRAGEQPKLVLQITVDGLRGDLPARFYNVLGEGGFRYLMEKGILYTNAHYQHANTETIVGHTSLATGTVPAAHGMVANVWFDREQDRLAYNIEDPRYHLLTAGADVDRKTEIDYTQKTARSDGRSPDNILTSTFSDELAVHFAGRSLPDGQRSLPYRSRTAVRYRWPVMRARPSGSPRKAASSSPVVITTSSIPSG
jgi:predicted AlkP superfamily pyrophosphatase or phosphodiesterase